MAYAILIFLAMVGLGTLLFNFDAIVCAFGVNICL